jgi:xylan 1,4-beta-xylosidase
MGECLTIFPEHTVSRQPVPTLTLLMLGLLPTVLLSQQAVTIQVDASRKLGPFGSAWSYFGYDEPNYTYAPNGRKLLGELASLSESPIHVRTHNLLTTGDGTAALKWGSTNVYTEDASGKPIYDWTIVDKILDSYLSVHAKPFMEIGFMPKALSIHPDPYQHNFPKGDVFTGWSYPPSNYEKWSELVFQWVKHCADKYGRAETASWEWEVWNEPDIPYWHGTPEEYDELYDYTVAAVRRALPGARVGGPASTSPSGKKAAAFLRQFLEHCSSGKNYATGKQGAALDFITFHAKGRPEIARGHVVMGLAHELQDAAQGFQIVQSFEKFRRLPLVLSEADPEGCAACSARTNPGNAYRNGTLYSAYEAVAMKAIMQLADRAHANLQGILTWAFEFEGQPYFECFRTLATNGIDKPVLNFFRMAGILAGDSIDVKSSGGVTLETLVANGVRDGADVDALAVRGDRTITVMIWNYCDEDGSGPAANVALNIAGIPTDAKRLLVRHYRIDQDHSNAYVVWKQLGSPQDPSSDQYEKLDQAGQLQLLESPRWIESEQNAVQIPFSLSIQGLSLVELTW